MKVVSGCF